MYSRNVKRDYRISGELRSEMTQMFIYTSSLLSPFRKRNDRANEYTLLDSRDLSLKFRSIRTKSVRELVFFRRWGSIIHEIRWFIGLYAVSL